MKRLALLLLLAAPAAGAQTIVEVQERLIQIHSLLVGLDPAGPPGAYAPGELGLGIELIVIPPIDGQMGAKRQITASDQTPLFPRPRLALGLPAPRDFRAFVGATYVPPFQINGVSSHQLGLEAGYAWAPPGPLSIGLRAHALFAESKSPVTEPNTRDTLDSFDAGADVSAGYRIDLQPVTLTPFAGAGFVYTGGSFRVTSDNDLLTSDDLAPAFHAGARLRFSGLEAAAEVVAFPGVLIHPVFTLAWTPRL